MFDNLPSGKQTWLWKITIFDGSINYKWAMFNSKLLVYQRVSHNFTINHRIQPLILDNLATCNSNFTMFFVGDTLWLFNIAMEAIAHL